MDPSLHKRTVWILNLSPSTAQQSQSELNFRKPATGQDRPGLQTRGIYAAEMSHSCAAHVQNTEERNSATKASVASKSTEPPREKSLQELATTREECRTPAEAGPGGTEFQGKHWPSLASISPSMQPTAAGVWLAPVLPQAVTRAGYHQHEYFVTKGKGLNNCC